MSNTFFLQSHKNLDASVLAEFKRNTNIHADVRDALIFYLTDLEITTPHSVKLQASVLAHITQATNQLTRNALVQSPYCAVNVSIFLADCRNVHLRNAVN